MRKFMPRVLFIAMTMASAMAGAAESGFFVGLEVNRGGDLVYPGNSPSGQAYQVTLREGANTTVKAGYDLLATDWLAIRGAVGYARESDGKFSTTATHTPAELMFFYRKGKNHRFGIGPVVHWQRAVDSEFSWSYNVAADTTVTPNIPASDTPYVTKTKGKDRFAKGFKLEYDYDTDYGFYVGVQYTYMKYEYQNKVYIFDRVGDTSNPLYNPGYSAYGFTGKTNGSSAGLSVGLRF